MSENNNRSQSNGGSRSRNGGGNRNGGRSFGGGNRNSESRGFGGGGNRNGGGRGFGGGNGGRGKRKIKVLDTKLFVKKAKPIEETVYTPTQKYTDFDLHPKLQAQLKHKGYEFPTEIQDKTINEGLNGENILGIANTGTGKTGAFLIPVIDRLLKADKPFQTMVIVPTRELAVQVEEEFASMTFKLKLWSACLVGGTSIKRNLQRLAMYNHLIVGTPGRMIDMVERGALDLKKVDVLILDEFDRMLDMGFVSDVRFMKGQMENLKQTMLFSATLDRKLQPIVDEMISNPHKVMASTGLNSSDNVEQDIVRLERGEDKFDKLVSMLSSEGFHKVLIFAETKRTVDNLHRKLKQADFKTDLIHGDKTQRARDIALKKFKSGRVDILIATDVAARGLDIKGVSHVINYQPPETHDSYIHRIGRTGRAGATGFAFTFVN